MIVNRLLKLPIRSWHRFVSPALPPTCRFYPSCAVYALEALDRHPWPRALALILRRLVRCQPFHPGGYDPVPGADPDEDRRRAALRPRGRRRPFAHDHPAAHPHSGS
ncbi:MAG TPA: membrane protein insertion efficiency factor YidD [Candidatus Sumerlaeota bacterium]|nr:membrane protein insertion efficiency factor YidD [Candidatus Sumerlaeota bacterium]